MGSGASAAAVGDGRAPTLYIYGLSAPSRAAWMTARAANIPINIKYLDLFKGEHKAPEFQKVYNV
jgi:glutathione S-transferase